MMTIVMKDCAPSGKRVVIIAAARRGDPCSRREAQVVRMIPPPADRSGITRTPLQSLLRARRMIGIYYNEDRIRRASAGSQRAWYTMRRAGGHRQVVG